MCNQAIATAVGCLVMGGSQVEGVGAVCAWHGCLYAECHCLGFLCFCGGSCSSIGESVHLLSGWSSSCLSKGCVTDPSFCRKQMGCQQIGETGTWWLNCNASIDGVVWRWSAIQNCSFLSVIGWMERRRRLTRSRLKISTGVFLYLREWGAWPWLCPGCVSPSWPSFQWGSCYMDGADLWWWCVKSHASVKWRNPSKLYHGSLSLITLSANANLSLVILQRRWNLGAAHF